jgi:hypothetical protein
MMDVNCILLRVASRVQIKINFKIIKKISSIYISSSFHSILKFRFKNVENTSYEAIYLTKLKLFINTNMGPKDNIAST